jgi:hypothetical protein
VGYLADGEQNKTRNGGAVKRFYKYDFPAREKISSHSSALVFTGPILMSRAEQLGLGKLPPYVAGYRHTNHIISWIVVKKMRYY